MSEADDQRDPVVQKISEDIVDFGESIALLMEQHAKAVNLKPWQCVLALPALVGMILKRMTKVQPGAMTDAGEEVITLLRKFIELQEAMRRKEWH